jgi:hypothetical protein
MWKKVVVLYFKVLPQHLSGTPEENHKTSVTTDDLWLKI